MDENTKRIQREIAKDKIQVTLSGIAVAVLVVMELYIMINYASNFMFMAVGVLLMIVALFFLISAVLDLSLKTKDMEEQKYEEIYNAQKASYLVIKKSFDELDTRLRNIEENSSLPAEDIINAQKAVAKVTISRSKENTDALMNSNDELINQLFSIKEKIESNNTQIIEKQQALLKETNFDIQQKIAALTSQISNIEGRIQNGIPVMTQPIQMTAPVMQTMQPQTDVQAVEESATDISVDIPEIPTPEVEEPVPEEALVEETQLEETVDELGLDISEELEAATEDAEETVEDVGIDLDMPVSEESVEEPVEDIGLDLDMVVSEGSEEGEITDEPTEDLGLDLDIATEAASDDEISLEPPVQEMTEETISLDETELVDEIAEEVVEEPQEEITPEQESLEEIITEEAPADETIIEEAPIEESVTEETAGEEAIIEEELVEVASEEPQVSEEPTEEIILEAAPEEEVILSAEPAAEGVDLDALLEEVGGAVEEETAPEPEPEPPAEDNPDEIVIPDVGVDLTDPNRVMSAEEIEKLFANI